MDDTMNPNTQVKSKDAPAIGIDLGTSTCCVGVVREGKVEIIENERGSKITPSYVAFTKTMRVIGEDAKNQASQNPTNTVFGVKRIIGRSFADPSLQDVKHKFPFTVKQMDGKPRIEVTYREKTIDLSPEQVSAMLLTKMKLIAEFHLKCKVTDAVISVPAYFTNAQRQATKDAAAIAGLKVLGLINEPTAAALAYRDNMGPTDETICVVDLGGGTLDVSIITLNPNDGIKVEQTMGDTALGGMDFDQQLVDHFVREFCETTKQIVSEKGLERVRLACEKLKHKLSLLPTAKIQLDCLAMDTDFESSIDRKTFEDLCLKDLVIVLRRALHCTKLGRKGDRGTEITKIVVVGGSTRIPLVQEILKDTLGKNFDTSINPDEAVAHGAAIQAALLAGDRFLKEVEFQEIIAHAVKMEIGQFRDDVFQRNSHETQKHFFPPPELDINAPVILHEYVYNAKSDNEVSHYLGSVDLSDLAKPLFSEMVFRLDDNGIFCRNIVVDKNQYSIQFYADYLNTDQLTQMRSQEVGFQEDEESEKQRLVLLSSLGDSCYSKKNLIEELSVDDDSKRHEDKKKFINFCDDTIDWLDCNPEATKDHCESKNNELQVLYNALIQCSNNTNEIKTKKINTHSVDTTKPASKIYRISKQSSTKNSPKLNSIQSIECPGEEEDPQVKRLNKQEDGDVVDHQTLQRDGDPAVGLPTENNTNRSNGNCIEYYDGGENTSDILGQKSLAPSAVPAAPRNTSLEAISSTKIALVEDHFKDESALSVDSEGRNTSVDPDEFHQSGPTTAMGVVSSDVSFSDAQGSCSPHFASQQVKQLEMSSKPNNSKRSRVKKISNSKKKLPNSVINLMDKLSGKK